MATFFDQKNGWPSLIKARHDRFDRLRPMIGKTLILDHRHLSEFGDIYRHFQTSDKGRESVSNTAVLGEVSGRIRPASYSGSKGCHMVSPNISKCIAIWGHP